MFGVAKLLKRGFQSRQLQCGTQLSSWPGTCTGSENRQVGRLPEPGVVCICGCCVLIFSRLRSDTDTLGGGGG